MKPPEGSKKSLSTYRYKPPIYISRRAESRAKPRSAIDYADSIAKSDFKARLQSRKEALRDYHDDEGDINQSVSHGVAKDDKPLAITATAKEEKKAIFVGNNYDYQVLKLFLLFNFFCILCILYRIRDDLGAVLFQDTKGIWRLSSMQA